MSIWIVLINSNLKADGIQIEYKQGQLFLKSKSEDLLRTECISFLNYSNYLRDRNNLLQVTSQCVPRASISPDFKQIEVGEFLPSQMLKRFSGGRQYDGVCYNTALVSSGILRTDNFSQFNTTIETFAGMIQPTIDFENSRALVKVAPVSDFNIVKSRGSWELNGFDRENTIGKIEKHVGDHFTPGSVLCREVTGFMTRNEVINRLTDLRSLGSSLGFQTNIEPISEGLVVESPGAHCLVTISPDLIIESNFGTAIEVKNLDDALRFLTQYLGENGNKKNSVFYLEIDQQRAKELAKKVDLALQTGAYGKIVTLLEKHHIIYENLGSQYSVLGYDAESLKNNSVKEALRQFHTKYTAALFSDSDIKHYISFLESPTQSELSQFVSDPFYKVNISILEMLKDRYDKVTH